MTRVHVEAQMPDDEVEDFLRRLRQWDAGRETVRLAMKVEATSLRLEDLQTIFNRLDPPLPFVTTIKTGA